jgi:hypothetical protein
MFRKECVSVTCQQEEDEKRDGGWWQVVTAKRQEDTVPFITTVHLPPATIRFYWPLELC